jgi:hypothetical protein
VPTAVGSLWNNSVVRRDYFRFDQRQSFSMRPKALQ